MKTSELIRKNYLIYERYKDQLPQLEITSNLELVQFRKDVVNAYDRIPYTIVYLPGQPYKNLSELTRDIMTNRLIKVSTDFNNSQLLPGDLNLKFRAVHDYLHFLFQQPFDFRGELNVYKCQKYFHTTELGKRLLYSEVVLQAAYCEYTGNFAPVQKVITEFNVKTI